MTVGVVDVVVEVVRCRCASWPPVRQLEGGGADPPTAGEEGGLWVLALSTSVHVSGAAGVVRIITKSTRRCIRLMSIPLPAECGPGGCHRP
jgi:hypothetical protein